MPEVTFTDPFDPEKIYDDLIGRCKDAKCWNIRCLVDESWTGFHGKAPFGINIKDGVFTCKVIASTHREAMLKVVDNVPVIKFLDELED